MAKPTANPSTPAQGSEGGSENLFDRIVTQEDLDNNKDLIEAGVKLGDTIKVPAEKEQPQGELLTAETPEWVEQILASNQAVIESNQAVINSNDKVIETFVSLKESASRNVGEYTHSISHFAEDQFDPSADYKVAEGKSFRDPKNFDKKYTEGEDVSHLPIETLERLHANGLIVEA